MGKIKRGNVRHESYTIKQRVDEVIHDLRYEKTIHMTDDENLKFKNVIFEKSKRFYFEYGHQENKKSIDKIKEDILDEITKTREEHKLLFKKYNKRSLREEKYNSINRGILTFENQRFKSKTKQEKEKFIKDGYERIKKYCELKKIKLLYVVYHDDEESGHFHFMTSNYYIENDKLKSLNIKKNKNMGKELQDFYYENFTKNHGYERGLSKELTKRKHQKLGTSKREQQLELSKRETNIENKIKNLSNELEITKVDRDLKTLKLELFNEYDDLRAEISSMNFDTEEKKKLHKINKERKNFINKSSTEEELMKYETEFKKYFEKCLNDIKFNNKVEEKETEIKKFNPKSFRENNPEGDKLVKEMKKNNEKMEEDKSPQFKPVWKSTDSNLKK